MAGDLASTDAGDCWLAEASAGTHPVLVLREIKEGGVISTGFA